MKHTDTHHICPICNVLMDSSTTVNHDYVKLYIVSFNPIDKDYIVSWQSDLENTKESIHPVCDKPYHKIKENMPLGEELENVWNYPLYLNKA